MLLRQRVKAALPNTQKQTQGGCHIEERKKYGPSEWTEQNSRKRTKWNKITNLSDAQLKILVIRVLKEITGYCNSIKKTQAEKKVALSETKKTQREPTAEGMKLKIKSMIWNTRKKKHSIRTARWKKNFKKWGLKEPWGQFQTYPHPNHRGARRRRGRARHWKFIWKNNERKLP